MNLILILFFFRFFIIPANGILLIHEFLIVNFQYCSNLKNLFSLSVYSFIINVATVIIIIICYLLGTIPGYGGGSSALLKKNNAIKEKFKKILENNKMDVTYHIHSIWMIRKSTCIRNPSIITCWI